jgi:3-deoxy-manno-octulosonate cytidylyltransferase (CMP-KDO synthetase)
VIIPARFGSTRFAAKILAAETGKPLVQHVVEQAQKCKRVREVIVATDDQRIVDALKPFKTKVVMTSPDHPSGTDRIGEVARDLRDDIIVNVQGDEPEIEPATIDALVARLSTGVVDQHGLALYFSRSPIPYPRDREDRWTAGIFFLLHQGIYGYRREFLLNFAKLPPTPLETTEKLEQLRALEHGHRISVLVTERAVNGIDTPEQYQQFVTRYLKQTKAT